jgi:L-amino acid N-acyltransferase
MLIIRKMTEDDIVAVTKIYNEAIVSTTATFDIELKTTEEQRVWYLAHGPKHPILVSQNDNKVTGWASISMWSDRGAYRDTAEVSVYVNEKCRGEGIGKKLLSAIIEEGRKSGLHTIIARIVAGNDPSFYLFKSFGFETIGTLREVGFKFGSYHDIITLQIFLKK